MLISLLISLIVLGVIYWLFTLIPLPIPPWLLQVVFGLIAVLLILDAFGIYHSGVHLF